MMVVNMYKHNPGNKRHVFEERNKYFSHQFETVGAFTLLIKAYSHLYATPGPM